MNVNLREGAGFGGGFDAEAASSVMKIEKNAAIFFRNGCQRPRDEFVAIARDGTKNISG